jgi:hypothetical protein
VASNRRQEKVPQNGRSNQAGPEFETQDTEPSAVPDDRSDKHYSDRSDRLLRMLRGLAIFDLHFFATIVAESNLDWIRVEGRQIRRFEVCPGRS